MHSVAILSVPQLWSERNEKHCRTVEVTEGARLKLLLFSHKWDHHHLSELVTETQAPLQEMAPNKCGDLMQPESEHVLISETQIEKQQFLFNCMFVKMFVKLLVKEVSYFPN